MPKRTKVAGTATPEQVQAALKTYKKPHEQKRLLALKMAQQGQFTRAQIGDTLNKSRATIGRSLVESVSFWWHTSPAQAGTRWKAAHASTGRYRRAQRWFAQWTIQDRQTNR